jgi:hypothetical protein
MKDLYSENYKTLKRKLKTLEGEWHSMLMAELILWTWLHYQDHSRESINSHENNNYIFHWTGRMAQVAEHLPCKHDALSSNSSATEN